MIDKTYYWYGIVMVVYILTCWFFSAMRAFHTCQQPKKNRSYIWPDRKLQIIIYLMATLLLPYVFDPTSPSAWMLVKSYFPATYYFYCGALLFMFFGTVKQRSRWKNISWVVSLFIIIAMTPLVINAWVPSEVLSEKGLQMQQWIVLGVSLLSIPYCALSMWKVWKCIVEARDNNYSNPDDFPLAYARRVWLAPLILTPFIWPGFITDNPMVMACVLLPLSVFNVILLLTVMPMWRRGIILSQSEESDAEADAETEVREHVLMEERMDEIAKKIEEYVEEQKGYLNPHLKIDQVVEYCATNRTYVSRTFKERFGGFFNYVNRLRLEHYEQYMQENRNTTKDIAAQKSGFSSYQAYYNASRRLQ